MNIINLKDKNLFYIGGVVRDEILNKESFDIDLTYHGNAIEFARTIPDAEIIQINEPLYVKKGEHSLNQFSAYGFFPEA